MIGFCYEDFILMYGALFNRNTFSLIYVLSGHLLLLGTILGLPASSWCNFPLYGRIDNSTLQHQQGNILEDGRVSQSIYSRGTVCDY